ncbi:MAG: flagellar biosynthetic protein FliO [Nitrospirota bacterium]
MDFGENLVRTISSLVIVLALMAVFAAVARRLLGSRILAPCGPPLIQVLGTGYLGPRKTIAVVAVGGELLIVGTTPNDLVPLGRITDPEQVKRIVSQRSAVGVIGQTMPGQPGAMSAMASIRAWVRASCGKSDKAQAEGTDEHGRG